MEEFKIELTTGNRFWTPKGLGALGMDPNRAIAELVANALDWRRLPEDSIEPIIQVRLSKGTIEIRDNGVGMTTSELQNAIQVSVANDSIRPNLRLRKGMFGMGMKVACLTLGWRITIHTRSISETGIENYLNLDTRRLDTDGTSNSYRDAISGRKGTFMQNSPLGSWTSGTSIRIEDLTYKSLSAIAVKDSLQEVFGPEIGVEKINIEVVDIEDNQHYKCEKVEVAIYPESRIDLDDLDLFIMNEETGKREKIRGWLGLMKKSSSGSGNWGLHLFKNNQIIERYHQLPARLGGLMPKNPHPKFGRTYGEIHLDMCKPAFHKVGFDYSTESWKLAVGLLHEHILAIMNASEEWRAKDYEKTKETIKKIQRHKQAVKATLANKNTNEESRGDAPKDAIVTPGGQWFIIIDPVIDKLGNNERNSPWIYYYRKQSRELAIVINEESPAYQNLLGDDPDEKSLRVLLCWAISDSIEILLVEHFNFTLPQAVQFRNQQLEWLTSERGGGNA